MDLKNKVEKLKQSIEDCSRRAGRRPGEICLIAVSKKVSAPRIKEALECGLGCFGESYAQELRDKWFELEGLDGDKIRKIRWHFIGHLQPNKVKYVVGKVELIHSLDNVKTAGEIDKRSGALGIKTRALVEVNVAGEAAKHGIMETDIEEFLESLVVFKNLTIEGLMTMAPLSEEPEDSRKVFSRLRHIRDSLKGPYLRLTHLSMGMTNDYKVAIEEGATLLRIGTAVFGPRNR